MGTTPLHQCRCVQDSHTLAPFQDIQLIVDRSIDKIAAQLDSSHDGVAILGIRAHIMVTEIGSKANGGDLQPLKFAEMLLCDSSL
jgi:hypothetical protein